MSQAEHTSEHAATSLGVDNRKLGVWTFLGSEVVFFASLIAVYIVMHSRAEGGVPPREALSIPLVSLNTFILLTSSLSMVLALAAIQRGDERGLRRWLMATALLGVLFLAGQAVEFSLLYSEGVTLSSDLFGASFFTLTGFHGMHVLIGVIAICMLWLRARAGGVTQSNHLAVELVGLYWHFVDIVWIVIFTVVYLIAA
jgi:cytochrome c oxidase subunit 3/cytochrome o ubiquinol oxidase subunit 3